MRRYRWWWWWWRLKRWVCSRARPSGQDAAITQHSTTTKPNLRIRLSVHLQLNIFYMHFLLHFYTNVLLRINGDLMLKRYVAIILPFLTLTPNILLRRAVCMYTHEWGTQYIDGAFSKSPSEAHTAQVRRPPCYLPTIYYCRRLFYPRVPAGYSRGCPRAICLPVHPPIRWHQVDKVETI